MHFAFSLRSRLWLLDAELLSWADNCRFEIVPLHNLLDGGAVALGDKAKIVAATHRVDVAHTLGTLLLKVGGVDILLEVERVLAVNLLLVADKLAGVAGRQTQCIGLGREVIVLESVRWH